MLLKIPILIAVGYLWINSQNSILAASAWGITLFLFGLMISGFSFALIIGSFISFFICFGVFALLDYLDGSGYQWLFGLVGITLLLLIG
jgi:phosphatidylglycerophosphate synthase